MRLASIINSMPSIDSMDGKNRRIYGKPGTYVSMNQPSNEDEMMERYLRGRHDSNGKRRTLIGARIVIALLAIPGGMAFRSLEKLFVNTEKNSLVGPADVRKRLLGSRAARCRRPHRTGPV